MKGEKDETGGEIKRIAGVRVAARRHGKDPGTSRQQILALPKNRAGRGNCRAPRIDADRRHIPRRGSSVANYGATTKGAQSLRT